MDIEKLKYPIGRHELTSDYPLTIRIALIETIRSLPERLYNVVFDLDEDQLNTAYREGGWTVRQVVHHLADSHINSYVRFHRAMTEDNPIIKAYEQTGWASLPDATTGHIDMSLNILNAIHHRWTYLLDHMSDADFKRGLSHPEWNRDLSLEMMVSQYAWHGEHHKAHITSLRDRMNW